jgi:tetratricopeptide (TPR) repeat protein
MDLTPWAYWTKEGEPTEYTQEIISLLEGVLARNPDHIGANHFYIHAVEASKDNERALPSAERLKTLAPGAGHLVHMSAHTYWRLGRYHEAAEANHHAIHADERYFPDRGMQATDNFYGLGYYNHNIHFLYTAAQMEGDSATAIEAARKLVAGIPVEVYTAVPPLEDFQPMALFALLRFGKWDEILAEAQPAEELRYSTGVWHYARGMAQTRLGNYAAAAAELAAVQALAEAEGMAEQVLFSFSTPATNLTIAGHTLAGELAAAQGDFDTAVSELESAVAVQAELPYIEPPAWYYPVRQSLGAVLLAAGRAEEAEAVYRADLAEYPQNGWSLYGLAEALAAQGKAEEAAAVEEQLAEAWANADVELSASRF